MVTVSVFRGLPIPLREGAPTRSATPARGQGGPFFPPYTPSSHQLNGESYTSGKSTTPRLVASEWGLPECSSRETKEYCATVFGKYGLRFGSVSGILRSTDYQPILLM